MPNFGIPGVDINRRRARIVGVLAVVVAVAVAVLWSGALSSGAGDTVRIRLRTEQIGDGVIDGTKVSLDGVNVGSISDIVGVSDGHQLITLALDRSRITGLTDDLSVDYAPTNLFGVTTVALKRGFGGLPLHEDELIDLAGAQASKVSDMTMGALLRSITQTTSQVLTPELTDLLTKFSGDLAAFTPILQAVVMTTRAIADTQRFPSSQLLALYGSFLHGLGSIASGTFVLLYSVLNVEVFQHDRKKYDTAIDLVANQLFPLVGGVGDAARGHLEGLTTTLTPPTQALAGTVPAGTRSAADVTELLRRLNALFADAPGGPQVNMSVVLHGMPGVALPLLAQAQQGGR